MAAHAPPALVDQAVVGVAQQDQVVEVGRSSPPPVPEVVGLQPPAVRAPREPAAPVPAPRGASPPHAGTAGLRPTPSTGTGAWRPQRPAPGTDAPCGAPRPTAEPGTSPAPPPPTAHPPLHTRTE